MATSAIHRLAIAMVLLAVTLALHGCKSEEQASKDFEKTSAVNAQKGEDKLEEEEAGLTDAENKNGLQVSALQVKQTATPEKITQSAAAEKSKTLKIKVGATSFQQVTADESTAEQLHSIHLANVISTHLAKAVEKHDAAAAGQAGTGSQLAEASAGMSKLREESKGLRQAVEALGLNLGLHHADARAKLQEVASDTQRVHHQANMLDRQLESIERLHQKPPASEKSEDDKFAELEKQTSHVMEWFNQLKQLKADRDKMKVKKDEAMQAAAGLGISPADIQKELIQKGLDPDVVAANTKTA